MACIAVVMLVAGLAFGVGIIAGNATNHHADCHGEFAADYARAAAELRAMYETGAVACPK